MCDDFHLGHNAFSYFEIITSTTPLEVLEEPLVTSQLAKKIPGKKALTNRKKTEQTNKPTAPIDFFKNLPGQNTPTSRGPKKDKGAEVQMNNVRSIVVTEVFLWPKVVS